MEKERKLQIIKAAEKRFVKHGLHKTTLDEIARDLRISKSTLYHYFLSKENLYFSTLGFQIEQYISRIKEIFNQDLPARDKINEYLAFKEKVFENFKLILALFIQFMNSSYLEEEIGILKELYLREEDCLKDELSHFNFKDDSLNFTFASLVVHQSWGIILNTRITEKSFEGTAHRDIEFLNFIIDAVSK